MKLYASCIALLSLPLQYFYVYGVAFKWTKRKRKHGLIFGSSKNKIRFLSHVIREINVKLLLDIFSDNEIQNM